MSRNEVEGGLGVVDDSVLDKHTYYSGFVEAGEIDSVASLNVEAAKVCYDCVHLYVLVNADCHLCRMQGT